MKTRKNRKHGGVRPKKSNSVAFRKHVMNTIAKSNLTKKQKQNAYNAYRNAAKAGLATPAEICALVRLSKMKYPELYK